MLMKAKKKILLPYMLLTELTDYDYEYICVVKKVSK